MTIRQLGALALFSGSFAVVLACTGSKDTGGDAGITPAINGPFTGENVVCNDQRCSTGDTCVDCVGGVGAVSCGSLYVCAPSCTFDAPACSGARVCVIANGAPPVVDSGVSGYDASPYPYDARPAFTDASAVDAGPRYPTTGTCAVDCSPGAGSCALGSQCVAIGGGHSACVPSGTVVAPCVKLEIGAACASADAGADGGADAGMRPPNKCPYTTTTGLTCGAGAYCARSQSCFQGQCECSGKTLSNPVCCDGTVCPTSDATSCNQYCAARAGMPSPVPGTLYFDCAAASGPSPGDDVSCAVAVPGMTGTCFCADGRKLEVSCTETRSCETRCASAEGTVPPDAGAGDASADGSASDGGAPVCKVTGKSFAFDSGAYIDFGNLGVFPAQGTIEMWLKPSVVDANTHAAFATFAGAGGVTFGETSTLSFLSFGAEGSAPQTFTAAGFSAGQWTHVALTWNRSSNSALFFVAGRLVTSFTPSQWPSALSDLRVGASTSYGFWRGQIDEVRVSSTQRYSGPFTPTFVPFASGDPLTLALYHFDEPSVAGGVQDSSGKGHAGTASVVSGYPQPTTESCN